MRAWGIALCCAAGLALGCSGGASTNPPSERVTPTKTTFKQSIDSIAKSGEIGSNGPELNSEFEELQKSDPTKAEAVKPQFDELMKASNPAKVKQLAGDIAKKL